MKWWDGKFPPKVKHYILYQYSRHFSFINICSDLHDHSGVAHLSCHCHSLWREEWNMPVWHGGVWASPCSSDCPGGWEWWVQQCQPQPTWLRWSPGAHRVAHVSMHDYRGFSWYYFFRKKNLSPTRYFMQQRPILRRGATRRQDRRWEEFEMARFWALSLCSLC